MSVNDDLTLSNVGARIKAPTPAFFRKLRTIGLIIGGVGAALLASPVALPAAILSAAGYLFTAGTVIAAVCQVTTPAETSTVDLNSNTDKAVEKLVDSVNADRQKDLVDTQKTN